MQNKKILVNDLMCLHDFIYMFLYHLSVCFFFFWCLHMHHYVCDVNIIAIRAVCFTICSVRKESAQYSLRSAQYVYILIDSSRLCIIIKTIIMS